MTFSLTTRVLSLLAVASVVAATSIPQTLVKDVVIIGGGASGVHAAIRLRDDFGKSIALIEKQEILV
jgi:ribulose 1,5-bisphosphate synthetase/thiazole synthase